MEGECQHGVVVEWAQDQVQSSGCSRASSGEELQANPVEWERRAAISNHDCGWLSPPPRFPIAIAGQACPPRAGGSSGSLDETWRFASACAEPAAAARKKHGNAERIAQVPFLQRLQLGRRLFAHDCVIKLMSGSPCHVTQSPAKRRPKLEERTGGLGVSSSPLWSGARDMLKNLVRCTAFELHTGWVITSLHSLFFSALHLEQQAVCLAQLRLLILLHTL
ncbi:hypothetical protein BKA66DRAFT_108265 [Pyrenochaeta sp. MPI-SDFR-AT-0127]|nr:hypothetical protein BKA66DRAFT_108265 [Pyrenochaeta sp. MPI-SDFR-AT-0127]